MKLLFILLITNIPLYGIDIKECQTSFAVNSLCYIQAATAKPTQALVGKALIAKKVKKIEKLYAAKALGDEILSKIIPAVISPDEQFYILDGHHSTYSLLHADIPNSEKRIVVFIQGNFSQGHISSFHHYMQQDGHSYLFDSDYNPIDFDQLPGSLFELQDDPYRSLASLVRKEGCFVKADVNFLEFLWGSVLRKELQELGISLSEKSTISDLKALKLISCSVANKSSYVFMPGYANR